MPRFPEAQALRAGVRYCRWLTRHARSQFSSSFLLLPPPQRRGMEVVYAYCRAMDDVVDSADATRVESARAELDRWRRELGACAEGFPAHPIAVALRQVQHQFQVPWEFFEKLIVGVEMDLLRRRYDTFEELQSYCEHVASVVGRISVRVFGCRSPHADRYAQHLGIALQMTNILRDLKEDARGGRIYLPREDLKRFGYSEEDLGAGRRGERFRRLMSFECERTREYFRRADEDLRSSQEAGKLLAARVMGKVYERLLRRIEQVEYDVFSSRLSVPRGEQVLAAIQCLLTSSS